jgi:hypothetical protein
MADIQWGGDLVAEAIKRAGSIERNSTFSKAIIEVAKERLKSSGVTIQERAASATEEDVLAKLKKALDKHAKGHGDFETYSSPAPSHADLVPYPPINAALDVAYVLGTWKDIDPRLIAMGHPVAAYHMDADECAGMGYLLDLYYKERQFKLFNGAIQPFETAKAFGHFVGFFAAVVLQHNPYK